MIDTKYKYCPMCGSPLVERFFRDGVYPSCPECGFVAFQNPKLVTVVVIEHLDRFLLGKRNTDPGKDKWSFFSGYVSQGEKVEEAAVREVKEETNLDVRLEELIGIFSTRGDPHVMVGYRARVVGDDLSALTAQPEEVSNLELFALEDIPPLAFPADEQILDRIRSQRNQRKRPKRGVRAGSDKGPGAKRRSGGS